MVKEIEDILRETEKDMRKSVEHFRGEIAGIRTGRASTALVEELKVEYYGSRVPLKQLGNISVPEHNQILIQVWDNNAIPAIEKTIREELNLNPNTQGNTIRINLPPLTEERRKELARMLHKLAEEARVAVRNIRRDAKELIEELEGISEDEKKRALERLQKLTDKHIDEINKLLEKKEEEIMTV
ncbi:ribosome recycling factor [Hydrogenivirga sp. 128-5-R1-1]|uniref:ribosome recycling factor n=1 Tax=Hydrogenivirga sp. 128-5-R1-1 TaxID=392423 RepID=UPI00015EF8DB|nr:ribosome recycling factor [Hydrogenivirga sp. 128-5-R1-1]EDP74529.1 ribosome recycling factor [Hydrogenivirga sp. 128-5-R1-1]